MQHVVGDVLRIPNNVVLGFRILRIMVTYKNKNLLESQF
jgi:hypothetical protein